MPLLRLIIHPAADASTSERLTTRLTDLMATILAKKAELTSVLVECPVAPFWAIGTRRVTTSAMLEAAITAGKNTEAEKAAFIKEAYAVLRAELPSLDPVAYVILKEVSAESWGYDGQTQAARHSATAG